MLINMPSNSGKLFRILSPKEFLQVLKNRRDSIKTTRFIPPRLGTNDLGKIYVEYHYVPKSKTSKTKQRT